MIDSEDIKFIPEALSNLRSGANWAVKDAEIQWLDDTQTQPTDEEIQAEIERLKVIESKEQQRSKAKAERDKALNLVTYTLSDGSVYQVRPKDVPNFQLAIQRNQDVKWILADNKVGLTTVDELKEILNHGIQEGTRIWDEYTEKLEEINNQVK